MFNRCFPSVASDIIVDYSTSLTDSITLPSGLTTDHWLLLFDFASRNDSTTPSEVFPAGWSGIISTTDTWGGTGRTRAMLHIIQGNPSLDGTSVTGMSATGQDKRMMCVVVDGHPSNSNYTFAYDSSSGAPTITLTDNAPDEFLIVFAVGHAAISFQSPPVTLSYVPSSSDNIIAGYFAGDGTGVYLGTDSGDWNALLGISFELV